MQQIYKRGRLLLANLSFMSAPEKDEDIKEILCSTCNGRRMRALTWPVCKKVVLQKRQKAGDAKK